MRAFFLTHRIGIIFAIIVGTCAALPAVLAPALLGDDYRGMQFLLLDDSESYRARIHEVLDAHPSVASPNVLEYKEEPVLIPPLYEYVYALPAFLFGLDRTILGSMFLFPAILYFFLYLILTRMIRAGPGEEDPVRVWYSAAAALVVVMGMDIFTAPDAVSALLGASEARHLSMWTRLVNPIVGALVIFGVLLFVTRIPHDSRRIPIILAGILLAFSVGYFFSFGMLAATIFAYGVIRTLMRDRAGLMRLVWVGIVGFIVSFPYWLGLFLSMGGEGGRELAMRNGMFYTHEPVLNKFLLAASVVSLACYLFARYAGGGIRDKESWAFSFALILGSWLVFNQQIVTGREIWVPHFVQYTTPLALLALAIMSYHSWWGKVPAGGRKVLIALGILAALLVHASFAGSFRHALPEFKEKQELADALAFLEREAPKDCVVLLPEHDAPLEVVIPAYTKCNVYATRYVFGSFPRDRVLHNFLLKMRLNGVPLSEAREYLTEREQLVRINFFDDWRQNFGVGHDEWVLGRIDMLEEAYAEFLERDLKSEIFRYRTDYLAMPVPVKEKILSELPGLSPVGTYSGYTFYVFPEVGEMTP